MKKSFVKFIALALVLIMVLGAVPVSAASKTIENAGSLLNNMFGWLFMPIPQGSAFPEQEFLPPEVDGVTVTVRAPEGALPAGTDIEVAPVDMAAVQNAVDASSEVSGTVLAAVDITFRYRGEEIQPTAPVTVTMTSAALEGQNNLTVVHIDDQRASHAESVFAEFEEDSATFDADKFSVYAVVGDGETGQDARLNVRFFHYDDDTTPIKEILVTKRDKDVLDTIIPDPALPAVSDNELFCGWSVGKNYTAEDVDGQHTIDYIRDEVKDYLTNHDIQEGETFDVYAMVFHYFNVAYVDENGETTLSTDVYYSKNSSIELEVEMIYSPYLAGYRFMGWQKDDGDDTIYQNGQTATFSRPVTKLRAQVQQGYWLSFKENPGEHYSGATYVPPVFCPNGEIPSNAQPNDPTLAGYHLGDGTNKWFKTFVKGSTAADDEWSNPFSFSGTIDQDTTVYAMWTPDDLVNYTIIVWKQNIDNDKNTADSDKTYDYAFSVTKSIAPNTAISALDLSEYNSLDGTSKTVDGVKHSFYGFKYNTTKGAVSSDTAVVPKGTTVVNLYYDRELVTYYFYIPSGGYTAISGTPDFSTEIEVYYRSGSNYFKITSYNSSYAYYSRTQSQIDNTSSGNYAVLINKTFYTLNYSSRYNEWYFTYNNNTYYINDYPNLDYYAFVSISGTTFYKPSYNLRETFTGLYDQPLSMYNYTWKSDYRWYMKKGSFISIADNFTRWSSSVDWTSTFYGSVESFDANIYHFLMDSNGNYGTTADFTIPCKTTNGMLFRSFTGFENDEFRVKLPSGVSTYRLIKSVTDNGEDANPRYTYEYDGSTKTATDYHDGAYWTEWIPENRTVTYGDFEPDDMDHLEPLGGKIEFRYKRVQNTINYLYGIFVSGRDVELPAQATGQIHQSDMIYYQASIDSYKVGGADYYDPVVAGDFTDGSFIFAGWYVDPGCTTAYDFTGKKMPTGGVTVYAKFKQREYRVFLHVQDDDIEWEDVSWNDPDQEWNFRIAYDGKVSEGNAIEGVVKNNNNEITYVLIGWFTDEACTHPYNFSTRYTDALGDLAQTYGAAEKADPQYATEDDGTNKDVDRPWIDKMVHIYSKWRKVLPGATGITVVYDGVENQDEKGKFTLPDGTQSYDFTDPLSYSDNAHFLAHTATTPDADTYQFLYWEILDSDGQPTGEIVYPGMIGTIDADWAKVTNAPSTGGKSSSQPKAASSGTEKAATDRYQEVTAPEIGHSYLIGYVSGTTVNLLGNTLYNTSNNYQVTAVTVPSSSYSNGVITGDYSAYVWVVENNTSAMKFRNASAGYLGQSGGYLNFGTSYNTWTYDSTDQYVRSTDTTLTWQYLGYSSSHFDVYSSGYRITFFELVEEAGEPISFTKVDTPVAGISYVIVRDGYDYALSGTNHPNTVNAESGKSYLNGVQIERSGNSVVVDENKVADVTWTAGSATNGWTWQNVGNSKYLNYTTASDAYLTVKNSSAVWQYTTAKYFYCAAITDGFNYIYFDNGDYKDYSLCTSEYSGLGAISLYARTHTLTITYVMSDGSTAPAAYTAQVAEGVAYSVASPNVNGYTPNQATVSGTMNTADVNVTVTYTPDAHTVTFNWHGGSSTQTVNDGGYATAPANPGNYTENGVTYIFIGWDPNPANTPITSDQIFTAQYKREGAFIVTFKDWDGRVLKTEEVERGGSATAPANPSRPGFTFNGWDKDFTNVQSDLVVYATYKTAVTKVYTVTLRAVYGPKVPTKTTFITWHANNGSGDYKDSDEVVINENIPIEFPDGSNTDTPAGAKDGELIWGEDGTLAWAEHIFLGWARPPIGDEGGIYDDYDKELDYADLEEGYELDESDLFLRYVYPENDGDEGYFEAEINGEWKEVEYVAADELMPYHGMYAVWAEVFYIYHSGVGEDDAVETVVTTAGIKDPNATFDLLEGVNMRSEVNGAVTIDAFSTTKVRGVSSNSLYGGYYLEADAEHEISGITLPARVNGKLPAYDGTNWIWTNPQLVSAKAMKPEAGQTYYIKEVPADKFLQSYIHYTYYGLMEGEGNDAHLVGTGNIGSLFAISDIDDLMYRETGFIVKSAKAPKVHIVKSMTIQPQNHPENYATLTPEDLFHVNGDRNYLTYSILYNVVQIEGETNVVSYNEDFTVSRYWKTPDNLFVTGTVNTAYSGMGNVTTLTATNATVSSVISTALNTGN